MAGLDKIEIPVVINGVVEARQLAAELDEKLADVLRLSEEVTSAIRNITFSTESDIPQSDADSGDK